MRREGWRVYVMQKKIKYVKKQGRNNAIFYSLIFGAVGFLIGVLI